VTAAVAGVALIASALGRKDTPPIANIEYLLWAEKKDFDQDLLLSIRSEIKNRRRGGGFEQASNPFANL